MTKEKNDKNKDNDADMIVGHKGAGKTSTYLLIKYLIDSLSARPNALIYSQIFSLFSDKAKQKKKSLEQEKHLLVKQLLESDIDPVAFDVLLSNEINRRLKVKFGMAFLILTLFFTSVSYAIVILDGIYKWGISDIAITALVIETPIQFVGLLYIIARNLFPNCGNEHIGTPGTVRLATENGEKA
jgi:hypothetical protein